MTPEQIAANIVRSFHARENTGLTQLEHDVAQAIRTAQAEVVEVVKGVMDVEECRRHRVYHRRCEHCAWVKGRKSAKRALDAVLATYEPNHP